MGRMLVALGVALMVIGGIVMLLGRTGMPLDECFRVIFFIGAKTQLSMFRWRVPS